MDLAGAILSGGKNKRMGGRNKAFLEVEGVALLDKNIGIFEEIFDEIIIVTNSPREYEKYKKRCFIISDVIKDIGPLGGIHSALLNTSKKGVFFIACDMPFLHNATIRSQIELFNRVNCDVLVPKIGESVEPLHSVYKKGLENRIYSFVNNGRDYSVRNFFKEVDVYYWGIDNSEFNRNIFSNLNTPWDLSRIKGRA